MKKRFHEEILRILHSMLSGLACLGLFVLLWIVINMFGEKELQFDDTGIIIFFSILFIQVINEVIKHVRSILWDEELDELIREGSKTDEDAQAEELFKHLEVK